MKKNYVKPEIMFEDFSLSNSIAANCEKITRTQTENACGYEIGISGQIVFIDENTGCNYTEVITDTTGSYIMNGTNKVCYHVPDGYNLFNS